MLACVVQRKGLDDDVCAAGDFLPSCRWKVEKLGMKISTPYFARSMRGNDADISRKKVRVSGLNLA